MKYKYLITDEDGDHFVINEYTKEDVDAMKDGLITIIKLEDGTMLDTNKEWCELAVWGEW